MKQTSKVCSECKQEIDEDVCWCGSSYADHNAYYDGHFFVPMGCTCYYAKIDDLDINLGD